MAMNNALFINTAVCGLLYLTGVLRVDGFQPTVTTTPSSRTSSRHHPYPLVLQQQRAAAAFPSVQTQLFARKDKDDDEDDDADLLGGEQDWRDFRAKLVMSESSSSSSSSSTSNNKKAVFTDDTDLDGIGSIFQDAAPSSTSSSSSEAFVSEEGVELTPLDPSQWAYDSGKIIEQGAVILGGVEQDFGFGLRQQYFHKAAILVLDHEESTFTKGIILNRPTDLTLEDDINEGVKWRVWFGGVRLFVVLRVSFLCFVCTF
jgi:hypothetical protein